MRREEQGLRATVWPVAESPEDAADLAADIRLKLRQWQPTGAF